MKISLFQVDAFTDSLFSGNPAAVCLLSAWPNDEYLQKIAVENNLSETAFLVPQGNGYQIRWFTPGTEVELCGHATLASAHVLFNHLKHPHETIEFYSLHSGLLKVTQNNGWLTLDFPKDEIQPALPPDGLIHAIGKKPLEIWRGKTDYLLFFASQEEIEEMAPDFRELVKVEARGIIVTAPGYETDFVSRFFCPQVGIDEDPVTGSAHTTLTPFWAHRLNQLEFEALQLSKRGGFIKCKLMGQRVLISGKAVTFFSTTIDIGMDKG